MPTVSVILPSYNHGRYLKQRLESILNQTFSDFELIVLDDASTDNSADIIKEFVELDSRVSFYPSDCNSGSPFIQWNKGVRHAKGELIWIAESDDVAAPDFLQALVNQHRDNPGIALAFCQSNRMNDNGTITGSWKTFTDDLNSNLFQDDFVMKGTDFIANFLIHKNAIPNASGVLFKKSAYNDAGGANEDFTCNSDWLTWLKMLLKYDLAYISKPLNNFRYHSLSVIAKANNKINKESYREQYDYSMRNELLQYVKQKHINLSPAVRNINAAYLSFDKGNHGLVQLKKGQVIKGWKQILQASFHPKFQSGFIKKAIKSW